MERYTSQEITTIAPLTGWPNAGLKEIFTYKSLIWLFAKRNFTSQYRQMSLGPLWSILKPLFDMIIFTIVFGKVAALPSEGMPYAIFAYSALIPWSYFAEMTQTASGSLVNELHLISKVYFPRIVIPLSTVVMRLFDLFVSILILILMMLYYQVEFTWKILFFPGYIALAMVLGLGLGLWLATIAVRFRDVKNVTLYGLQVLKFATPVLYSAVLIPEKWTFIYQLNPMFWVVEGFRWCFLGTKNPFQWQIGFEVLIAVLLLVSGAFVFWRNERSIVDWL